MTSWWSSHQTGRPCVLKGADARAARPVVLTAHLVTNGSQLATAPGDAPGSGGILADADADDASAASEVGQVHPAFSALLEDAYAAGYDDAISKATREADERIALERERIETESHERLEHASSALAEALAALQRARRSAAEVATDDLVKLCFELTRTLIGRELEIARNPGLDSVARALSLAPSSEALIARVHPDDLGALGEIEKLISGDGAGKLEILGDPEVERGGCILEAGPCRIDAQIGPALERVGRALGTGNCTTPNEVAGSKR